MSIKRAILLVLFAILGYLVALDTANSEAILMVFTVFIGLFVFPLASLGYWAFKGVTKKQMNRFIQCMTAAAAAGAVGWWRVHPANIRYEFQGGNGASSTWTEVQFEHREHGKWIEGPWIAAWPMSVRFPDVNGDGYPDIEVSGYGRVVFVYLPNNDGRKFWHLV